MVLSWILVALLLLVSASPCLRWCLRYGRPRTIPACDCGYELSHLREAVCPECGTPHMVTWARFQRRRRVRALVIWTLAVGAMGAAAVPVSLLAAPRYVYTTQQVLYGYGFTDRPGGALTLKLECEGWRGGAETRLVSVRYTRDQKTELVKVTSAEDAREVVFGLLGRTGVPFDDNIEGYKQEVADAVANAFRTGQLPRISPGVLRSSGTLSTGSTGEKIPAEADRPPWLAVAVWVLGVWLIVRGGRPSA